MSSYIGGDIKEIACSHPVLGNFRFQVKANESYTYDPGGIRVNDDANSVTGSGQNIKQMNAVRWSFEGSVSVDLLSDNEMKNLPALAGHPLDGIWTITHISGDIRKGTGCPVGDLQPDTNTAMMTMKVAGGGTLAKI